MSLSHNDREPVYGVWSERSLIVHRYSETRRGYTDCGIDHRNMTEVRFTTGRQCRRCADAARKRETSVSVAAVAESLQ